MFWMRAMEARLEPSPMPIMAMTAPTPTMMPSMVRKARILLRVMANSASFRNSAKAMPHPLPGPRDCHGVSAHSRYRFPPG